MYVQWKTNEGFRHRRLTNRANRASAKSSKYTGGLATFMKTKARLLKSLDRDATLAETFKYTHALKENKENKERFSDQREEDASGIAALVVDSDAVWHEIALAPYKNRVYGLGSFFISSLHTSMLRSSFASATS
ncbi:hypothetical protein Ahy_B04g072536 [Arachis hypogaea]|uniref:Uncharacterized protein n=1 Tax=Arachis hypogaea TaxID=3818 RepID=A0A444ZN80_ARAHY|nr:hypothetical protein Ahy_B04g072536 [Arachis hypogaea]